MRTRSKLPMGPSSSCEDEEMNISHVVRDSFQGVAMGMMDGLITLLGIVMGVGAATGDAKMVIITGMVGGISNGFGTSLGFYTSEHAERGQQIQFYKKKGSKLKASEKYIHTNAEIYMETLFSFLACVVALIIPICPFFFSVPLQHAMVGCFIISVMMLYMLGFRIGKLNHEHPYMSALKYVIVGVLGATVALLIGELLKHILLENTIGLF